MQNSARGDSSTGSELKAVEEACREASRTVEPCELCGEEGLQGLQQSRKWTKLSRVMNQINIHQAKTQFSRLVERVAGGEEIIIAKSGKPIARLVPYVAKGVVRRPGAMRGRIRIKKNFDEPLPKEMLASFEGKS